MITFYTCEICSERTTKKRFVILNGVTKRTCSICAARHSLSVLPVREEFDDIRSSLIETHDHLQSKSCARCGSTQSLTIDHIVPIIAGGTNDPGNLQVLCKTCNSRKGARA